MHPFTRRSFNNPEQVQSLCHQVLDKKLKALKLNPLEGLDDVEPQSWHSLTGTENSSTRMIILGEDSLRTQYVPPKPTVKILKRPARHSQGSGDGPLLNGDGKPKQPIKSLKQQKQLSSIYGVTFRGSKNMQRHANVFWERKKVQKRNRSAK
ncbi:uncharacterized protein [Neodiprion pinetum]|uniref:uncharacterized protein isoform X5 n=1 Tax=Neodiprion pinetum TaxID=441929 RepID=UPI001EDEF13E|nr:uncharacterized protein LOC124220431 isoform X5 [Neodiprion pinetum]